MNRIPILGAALVLALMAPAGRDVVAADNSAAVIYDWNRIVQDTIPGAGGVMAPRFYTMTHVAMFDAVNAIERRYEPFRVHRRSSDHGSPEAAAAQAAHDVLIALNPAGTQTYDAALARYIGRRPSGFIRRGAEVGARVAREVLQWRQEDGWVIGATPAYAEPPLPGRWQPTPPNNPAAAFVHLQDAEPMALVSSTQLLPAAPPSLTSPRYAADFNEVKLLGGSDSLARTGEQTAIARLWASVATTGAGSATHAFAIWNNIASDVARQRNLSLIRAARLLAFLNMSIHDGLQTTQASKFVYGLWRPVTAIRQADTDLNPATDLDSTWLPLITTPPYPSYAGNMAGIGASAARALQLAFGTDRVPVTAVWRQSGGLPDVVHRFGGFWEVAEQQSMARIWGGIHYRFDQEAGQKIGKAAAEFVYSLHMQPRSRFDD